MNLLEADYMKMIVNADRKWGIGKDGKLLVHIPEDMDFFKKQTMGNVVVMGRRTFESFPGKKALPERINIVLTGNPDWQGEGAVPVHSREELAWILQQYEEESVYIIGGGRVYEEYLPCCDTIYVTHVEADFEADTWFPDLEADGNFVQGEKLQEGTWKDISYQIYEWKRKK